MTTSFHSIDSRETIPLRDLINLHKLTTTHTHTHSLYLARGHVKVYVHQTNARKWQLVCVYATTKRRLFLCWIITIGAATYYGSWNRTTHMRYALQRLHRLTFVSIFKCGESFAYYATCAHTNILEFVILMNLVDCKWFDDASFVYYFPLNGITTETYFTQILPLDDHPLSFANRFSFYELPASDWRWRWVGCGPGCTGFTNEKPLCDTFYVKMCFISCSIHPSVR